MKSLKEFSPYKPTLFLEGPNGESATIEITKDSARRANESADNFYVTAVLRAKGVEPLAGGDGFGPGYEGAAEQQAELTMGGELRMTLKGSLQFADERTKPMDFTLDFGPNPPRPADVSKNGEAAKEKPVPQRVHYIDAALSNDVFGVYVLSKWAMTSGEPNIVKVYQGQLTYFQAALERGTQTYVNASTALPSALPSSAKYPANVSQWAADANWTAIGFSLDSAHYYQYVSPGGATQFTARAIGNLDGNATYSTFERTGAITSGELQGSNIVITNELD